MQASASAGPNILQRFGRLIREKGQSDFDRVFKGTAKTRERLSVSDCSNIGSFTCPLRLVWVPAVAL